MNKILKRLDSIHQKLIDTVTPLDSEVFAARPSADEWSVAEIVQHLSQVEELVVKSLESAIARPPERIGFFRNFIPTSIVSIRLVRVKAPKAVNPTVVPEKNVGIGNLNRVRHSLKTLCQAHDERRLKQVVFNHPFLGKINGVATVSFVGYHELRHLKQIREVLKKLN
ncbi:MAG: DinB family protein [Acidobacteriota bacterium]|nr:DinB family protein [Acidobacteriota bacterium]